MSLEQAPVHQSFFQSTLLWNCDRELILLTGLTTLGLAFVGQTRVSMTVGAALFLSCFFLLKLMAKADPLMRQVYLRYLRYPAYAMPSPHPLHAATVDYH